MILVLLTASGGSLLSGVLSTIGIGVCVGALAFTLHTGYKQANNPQPVNNNPIQVSVNMDTVNKMLDFYTLTQFMNMCNKSDSILFNKEVKLLAYAGVFNNIINETLVNAGDWVVKDYFQHDLFNDEDTINLSRLGKGYSADTIKAIRSDIN